MSTTLEVLRGARELLRDEDRWIKGDFENGVGGFCLLGALVHSEDEKCLAYSALQRQVNMMSKTGFGIAVATFNDAKTTTHADVLDLLDKAIAAEEAK